MPDVRVTGALLAALVGVACGSPPAPKSTVDPKASGPTADAAGAAKGASPASQPGLATQASADPPKAPASQPAAKESPPPNTDLTIAAVGDILWGRYDENKKLMAVAHVDDPFAEIAPVLKSADLAFCNIESPVVDEPKSFGVYKRMTFRAPPEKMAIMAAAGFKIASQANNHMFNMKAKSIPESVKNVAAAGMMPGGAGATPADAMRPVVVEVHGVRVAFLFFTVWNNTGGTGFQKDGSIAFFEQEGKLEKIAAKEVRAARRYLGADYVIVSIHWGIEYKPHPHDGQTHFAKVVVEAGADMVLGHHAHVIEDVKFIGPAVVFYSLGNFLFDNPHLDQRETMVALPHLKKIAGAIRWVDSVELEPVMIDLKTHQPKLARGKDGAKWRKRLGGLVDNGVVIRPERE
jgi:poly-gamma-glutamate synthesis protein (capsule biosynthesis protein)